MTREDRLVRKLAVARWERDRWQRRYRYARQRITRLEERRAWAERYIGFRVEYRLRGWRRGLKRRYRVLRHKLGRVPERSKGAAC